MLVQVAGVYGVYAMSLRQEYNINLTYTVQQYPLGNFTLI
jgi:hypothetical protein